MSKDQNLMERVAACAALEGIKDPEVWVSMHRWKYTVTPGWGAAYAYALSMENADPGNDESVISDQMILTSVQNIIENEKRTQAEEAAPTSPVDE